ncbi:MAG TPA: helix-turn-helix domain-containing protein [Actinomycetes bacterium]|nr:helix-turn-helix domain-containing protein [Actinomycetes bacterium]
MAGFRSVAAIVNQHVGAFSLGVATEFFGYDRSFLGLPNFDFVLASSKPGPVRTQYGLTFMVEHGMDAVVNADLVLALPWDGYDIDAADEFVEPVRQAYDRGAIVVGFCTGTMLLAAAGLLDGKRATTHWRSAAKMAERYPKVKLDADVLYVDEGRVLTGAGGSAGVDVCLYLMRREYGASVAAAIARDIVVPPHREGGQAQYIPRPVPAFESDLLQDAIGWAREHIDEPLSVDQLAARTLMSPRSFARHFKQATGTTPHAWLLAQRMQLAEELLETTDLPVDTIARRVGFGTAAALREQFVRRRGVPPSDYRRVFRTAV